MGNQKTFNRRGLIIYLHVKTLMWITHKNLPVTDYKTQKDLYRNLGISWNVELLLIYILLRIAFQVTLISFCSKCTLSFFHMKLIICLHINHPYIITKEQNPTLIWRFSEKKPNLFLQDPNLVLGLLYKQDLVLNLEKLTALHRWCCSQEATCFTSTLELHLLVTSGVAA